MMNKDLEPTRNIELPGTRPLPEADSPELGIKMQRAGLADLSASAGAVCAWFPLVDSVPVMALEASLVRNLADSAGRAPALALGNPSGNPTPRDIAESPRALPPPAAGEWSGDRCRCCWRWRVAPLGHVYTPAPLARRKPLILELQPPAAVPVESFQLGF